MVTGIGLVTPLGCGTAENWEALCGGRSGIGPITRFDSSPLPSRVAGADLFICECTYHRTNFQYHLSHEELVANRSRFDCGRVIITHLGQEMVDRRATSDFEAADDGLTIRI